MAETFIVTTTLDSGPGSLRDALEKAAANGDRDQDYIYFDITRAREFIIYVHPSRPLPRLTSNLTIDGTTQSSAPMGASDARVGLAIEGNYTGTAPLYLFDCQDVTNIKIFGLFLKGNLVSRPQYFAGIYILGGTDIQIGEPGKGNVISGWTQGIHIQSDGTRFISSRIRVSSNIFGLETDGVSAVYSGRAPGNADNTYSAVFEKSPHSVTVGGPDATYGNIFNSSNTDIVTTGLEVFDGIITITNNKFGIDINGDNIVPAPTAPATTAAIDVSNINSYPNIGVLANPVITNNYIGGKRRAAGIVGTRLSTAFSIVGNTLGFEDRGGEPDKEAVYGTGIIIRSSFQGKIKDNIIRYWTQGAIRLDGNISTTVTTNSTYCNKKRAIEIHNWNALIPASRLQPFAYINQINARSGIIRGKSLPDNFIELFYNEDCTTCEGKTYFATVLSDANGDWSYSGTLSGDNISATAMETLFFTSEYSMPKVDESLLNITPVSCAGGLGSICGLRILSGTKWRWENEAGTIVGYDTCLRNVPAGKYFFKISIGSSCEETFEYTIPDVTPSIDIANVVITSARCGLANGSICGIRVRNGVTWTWEDDLGNTVGTNLCFNNARPGKYRLRLQGQGSCFVFSPLFDVPNKVPRVDAANAVVVNPSCGRDNGSIRGIQLTDMEFATRAWYNDAGVLISTNTDLVNAGPGRYKLVVKDNSGACGDSTAYFTLAVVPPPTMNTTGAVVTDASCGQNNGSIRGITLSNITGAANYWWVDQSGSVIATTGDLLNVPPGSYRLKVRDGSNCDTLFSPAYTISDRGSVKLDSNAVVVTAAGCTRDIGSITGMNITGATRLEWRNTVTGVVVSTSPDISGMPAGSYQLTAFNDAYGCLARSSVYTIRVAAPLNIDVVTDNTQHATCGNDNGSISLTQLNGNTAHFTFRWLKDSIAPAGTGLTITNLSPGTYHCIATDTNGCERAFFKKTINALPLPVLDETRAAIIADTCEFKSGRITGISVSSDVAGTQYAWYNAAGQVVGNSQQLIGASAGDYYLIVTDGRGCTLRSRDYSIPAVSATLPAPRYPQTISIPRNTDARLVSQDNRNVTYQLYDRTTGALIASNTTGAFVLQRVPADREVYITYTTGPCSSAEAIVRIKVFDETILTIPNAFSPNNDGINDAFRIQVLGYFRLNYLKVFNRYGQLVYEGRDLNLPWDGKRNGNPLPVGTYYWIIDGIDLHNKRLVKTGSVTLIR